MEAEVKSLVDEHENSGTWPRVHLESGNILS